MEGEELVDLCMMNSVVGLWGENVEMEDCSYGLPCGY